MTTVEPPKRAKLSIEWFRAFYESRPDEEHWELIDGAVMMMAPATKAHQRIAKNLERLLDDALELHHPDWAAFQRLGMNLRPEVDNYDPEPDVVVVDAEGGFDERYVDRFYLAAEILSDSDKSRAELKRGVYKLHPHCRCILTLRQDRQEVRIDMRTESDWQVRVLQRPTDVLVLDEFGLRCTVADLYRGTPLQARANTS